MPIHDSQHPHYKRRKSAWQLVERMLNGEDATAELVQRYFEHDDHFAQRKADADFTPRTAHLVQRLIGILFQREGDVQRELGPIPEVSTEDAGPEGEDYRVVMVQLASKLLSYGEAWIIVNPARGVDVTAPLRVPMWTADEAVVTGRRTMPGDVFQGVEEIKTYTRHMPGGYEVYRKGERGEPDDVLVEEGVWAENEDGQAEAFFVGTDGAPAAPIFRIRVPWEADWGLAVARKHRSIYEMTSRRDFALSSAMNGLIQLGTGADTDLMDEIQDKITRGSKYLPYDSSQGEHKGLQMPVDGATLGTEVLQAKMDELAEVAYNALDEAGQQSATEAVIRQQGGAAAALSVLAETMADAETRLLHFWAQAQDFRLAGPNPQPIDVSVEWPRDYSDVFRESDLVRRVFGSTVPVDVETATQVLVDYLADEGHDADEAALRERVQARLDRETQAADAGAGFFA